MRFTLTTLLLVVGFAPAVAQGPKLPDGTAAERNLKYGPHERNVLDVYTPKSDKPLPLVVWVHGGGWQGGSKDSNPALFLLANGYAVAGVNYRYSSHAAFPAQLHDCKAAVRFLRANAKKYNLDPDHIGVWGASAGGHLVALLGTTGDVKELEGEVGTTGVSSRVQAVCDWFGPTDLLRLSPPGAQPNAVTRLIGGDLGEKKELAKSADPITHITKDDAPFLIIHGDADKLVPLAQSELLHAALKTGGVPSELLVFSKAGHGDAEFRTQMAASESRAKLTGFFDKHLKK